MSNKDWKPTKGWLTELNDRIPKMNGDPAFADLGLAGFGTNKFEKGDVLGVFSEEQVVYLVNKALYALTYQREHHKKRAAKEQEVLGPLKKRVRQLFGVSYLNATDEQIAKAFADLRETEQCEEEKEETL